MERPIVNLCWRSLLGTVGQQLSVPDSHAAIQLGDVRLRAHQAEATARIIQAMRRHGGALLADDVGMGKTFVALAVARATARRTVVVAPAALKETWERAARHAGVEVVLVSVESLGLGRSLGDECDLLIVDEAHTLRNPLTQRYKSAARLAGRSPVLLLTATPVHNSAHDLHALLALFLGSRAARLSPVELAEVVIRREQDALTDECGIPPIEHAAPHALPAHDHLLAGILGLPAALPPLDGGDGGALVTFSLVRQWASSCAALKRALARRLVQGTAMLEAVRNGVHPTRSDLASWCASESAVQLPLFGLHEQLNNGSDTIFDGKLLAAAINTHLQALRYLLEAVRKSGGEVDAARDDVIRDIANSYKGEKIVAFSQFAETVRELYTRSLRWGRTAMMCGSSGHIASGRIPRAELLSMFAPRSNNAPSPTERMRVDILFTTDVLSEGVNLQDASVLIHVDLPWTPVRLVQRVGRLARTGSTAKRIAVHTISPPASAELLLKMERRLAAKLSVAARSAGVSGTVLPLLNISHPLEESAPQIDATIRGILRKYQHASTLHLERDDGAEPGAVQAACVRCNSTPGFLALVVRDGMLHLVASAGPRVSADPRQVLAVLHCIDSNPHDAANVDVEPVRAEVEQSIAQIFDWDARQSAHLAAGLGAASSDSLRGKVLRRIDSINAKAPVHLRPRLGAIAARARVAAIRQYGSGPEMVLAQLASADMPDEAWLRALSTFGDAQSGVNNPEGSAPLHVVALLLVR